MPHERTLPCFLDKRLVLPLVLVVLGIAGGIKLHGHLQLKETVKRHELRSAQVGDRSTNTHPSLHRDTSQVKENNAVLTSEKVEQIFEKIRPRIPC